MGNFKQFNEFVNEQSTLTVHGSLEKFEYGEDEVYSVKTKGTGTLY